MTNEIAIRSIDDAGRISKALAESGFYKDVKTAAQALVKVMAGIELGITPLAAMTGIHILEGKVTLGSGLVASQIQRSGKYRYRVIKSDNDGCELEFQELENGSWVTMGPNVTFMKQDAIDADLWGRATWKKYKKQMLFARCLTMGARQYTPSVFGGPVYTPEELGAKNVDEEGNVIDVPHEELKQEAKKTEAPTPKATPAATPDAKTPPTPPAPPAEEKKNIVLPTAATMKELQKLSESLALSDEERNALRERAASWDKTKAETNLEALKKKIDERQKNGVCVGQFEYANKILVTSEVFTEAEVSEYDGKLAADKLSFADANAILVEITKEITARKKAKAEAVTKKTTPKPETKPAPEAIQEAEVIETVHVSDGPKDDTDEATDDLPF